MSRIATSIVRGSTAGRSVACSTRTKSKRGAERELPFVDLGDGDSSFCLLDDVFDDRRQAVRLGEDLQLAVGAGAAPEDFVHVENLLTCPELIDDVIHEFQQLDEQFLGRDFDLLTQIDELSIQPEACGSP